ncbi:MAG: hypothetical protein JW862_02095, partial [Anaerolineales bacterium]|nr:hypothetical protein [Anaerolineales bacterium]
LENIVRHAQASQVRLCLDIEAGRLELQISDNGLGADLEHRQQEDKLGLQGMQERAAEVGGLFEVSSQPGQGLAIRFSVEVFDDSGLDL